MMQDKLKKVTDNRSWCGKWDGEDESGTFGCNYIGTKALVN